MYKSLGEVHRLAEGVGDLKRVLRQRKTARRMGRDPAWQPPERGADHHAVRKPTYSCAPARRARGVRGMPARKRRRANPVYLPIDSKFPQEDYARLAEASEKGDAGADRSGARRADTPPSKPKPSASRPKYIEPPYTTDFAIMFLPLESLYAEVVRNSANSWKASSETARNHLRSEYAAGDAQQPADGLPHAGDRKAFGGGLAATGRGEERFRQCSPRCCKKRKKSSGRPARPSIPHLFVPAVNRT